MSVYSNNPPHVEYRDGVTFKIIPNKRNMTSRSLIEGQDKLMGNNFPKEGYFIILELYTAMSAKEYQFAKSTLITFEGMIKKKLEMDRKLYHEAPSIYLRFDEVSTEHEAVYKRRLTEIRSLLGNYLYLENGLKYWINDTARPTKWAKEIVEFGIVNKDDYRLD
ncbi:hypothetical protein MMC31_004656 [Peltigera leucophlebia]|nr:hypothetical protein [Peltigera leucophlebia]